VTPERGGVLHERDGDFNPAWLLVIVFAAVGAGGALACWWRVFHHGDVGLASIAAMLTAFCLVVFVTGVYSLGRLKVLHGSSVLGQLAGRSSAGPAEGPPHD
jgi:hypothetical protein